MEYPAFGLQASGVHLTKPLISRRDILAIFLYLLLYLTVFESLYGAGMAETKARDASRNNVVVKVGMVGDAQVGKTTLMVKYVENKFDEEYIMTLGVNFMEKTITLRNTEITFSIWDLGGQREFLSMLPLVCNDAVAIFFMFDLSRKSTLNSIKEWYRQVRGLNRNAYAFLVGTKYDLYTSMPAEEQRDIDKQARKFAKAMHAPLIFTSASHSINVQKMFKVVLSRVFDLRCNLEEIAGAGEPLLLFSKEEGDAGKGKGGSGPTAAAGGGETAAAGGGGSKGGK